MSIAGQPMWWLTGELSAHCGLVIPGVEASWLLDDGLVALCEVRERLWALLEGVPLLVLSLDMFGFVPPIDESPLIELEPGDIDPPAEPLWPPAGADDEPIPPLELDAPPALPLALPLEPAAPPPAPPPEPPPAPPPPDCAIAPVEIPKAMIGIAAIVRSFIIIFLCMNRLERPIFGIGPMIDGAVTNSG